MKKKGLIIATIVMVLVLAVSLTTATYAWFTAAAVTKIDAFDVSVKTNNAVKIGVKANNTYESTSVTEDLFKTGQVTYVPGAAGVLGGGTWTGDVSGLSATIEHNIKWGDQNKSVGFSTTSVSVASSDDNTILKNIGTGTSSSGTGYIYAAEGTNATTEDANGSLANITAAVANVNSTESGDYVYLFLGAAPTRQLLTSELIILLDGSQGSGVTIGLLSAVHVAYRLNSAGTWTDARIFSGNDNQTPTPAAIKSTTLKANISSNLDSDENTTYVNTYGGSAPTTGTRALKITGLATTKDTIDQIELLIYIDGTEADYNNQNAISGISGKLSIFFHTTESNS